MAETITDPLFDLADRSILVAGGAGGLGAPLARALAQRGAKVLIADIDGKRAQEAAEALRGDGHQAAATRLDVVESNSCTEAVNATVKQWGRLDGMLNASGIYRVADALDFDDKAWEQSIDINVTGAFRLARAAGRVMTTQRAGAIVTLASVSSAVSNPRYAAYASSKAAVAHLTRVLAVEWAKYNVTVNAIGPAVIPTPLSDPIVGDPQNRAIALSRIPMGRFGTPDDLFGAAIFLLSPAAAFMTGQTIYVDGGRTVS
jgi:NAD(P)-dependent dehydrogenase (short-subunit alcohol dehydrogenase family)